MVSSHTKDLSVIAPVNGVVQEQVSKLAIKLHVSISTLFLCLILPAFAVFVAFIYKTNLGIYKENAAALITNHNTQMTDKLLALLDPIGDSLLTIAKQGCLTLITSTTRCCCTLRTTLIWCLYLWRQTRETSAKSSACGKA